MKQAFKESQNYPTDEGKLRDLYFDYFENAFSSTSFEKDIENELDKLNRYINGIETKNGTIEEMEHLLRVKTYFLDVRVYREVTFETKTKRFFLLKTN